MRYLVLITLSQLSQSVSWQFDHSVQLHHCMTLTDIAEKVFLYTLCRAKLYGWDAAECHDRAH